LPHGTHCHMGPIETGLSKVKFVLGCVKLEEEEEE
jgi:hypothetical protein